MKCPECNYDNPPTAKFCLNCGAKLVSEKICPKCGAELSLNVKFCSNCGTKLIKAAGTRIEELKTVTALFADMAGFTKMGAQLDPEETREIMSKYFNLLTSKVTEFGGAVEKYIGDAVMAVFGVPRAYEDDPIRATKAALAMQSGLKELSLRLEKQSGIKLAMRIGIDTGRVLVGYVGDKKRGYFTLVGDPVNMASRMETAAPIGGVLIGYNTYRQIQGLFDIKVLEPIFIKGKEHPVPVYEVIKEQEIGFRIGTRGVQGIETEMVGREEELNTLKSIFDRMRSQKNLYMVTVVGEAGIGKSRLLYEFNRFLDSFGADIFYHKARGVAYGGSPYGLISQVIRYRCGIVASDSAVVVREKLLNRVKWVFKSNKTKSISQERITEIAHFIGWLIGLEYPESPFIKPIIKDTEQIHTRALHSLMLFFTGLSELGPTVMVFEDLHWADENSLNVIEWLAHSCKSSQIMILALTRPELYERRANWGGGKINHTLLSLSFLTRENSKELVRELLCRVENIPERVVEMIVESAEGNPFYIEEIIKNFVDEGIIVKEQSQEKEKWWINEDKLQAIKLPEMVESVIQARIDRLNPIQRTVLHEAAVIGRFFWDELVEILCSEKEPENLISVSTELQDALESLKEKEFISEGYFTHFEATREYSFKHALTHKVAYENVLKNLRKQYHLIAGKWIEKRSGNQLEEYYPLIAEHYYLGENWEPSFEYYVKSGNRAMKTYANSETLSYYEKALSITADKGLKVPPQELISLYQNQGDVLELIGDNKRAILSYQKMLELATLNELNRSQVDAMNELAWIYSIKGELNEAMDYALRANRLSETIGYKLGIRKSLGYIAAVHRRRGESDEALDYYHRALLISKETKDKDGISSNLNNAGIVYQNEGAYEEALDYYNQSLIIDEEQGDKLGVAISLNNIGIIHQFRGAYNQAIDYLKRALKTEEEIGERRIRAETLHALGSLYLELFCIPLASSYSKKGKEIAYEVGISMYEVPSLALLAQIAFFEGKFKEALSILEEALKIARSGEDKEALVTALSALSEYWIERKDYSRASGYVRRLIPEAKETGMKNSLPLAYYLQGRLKLSVLMDKKSKQEGKGLSDLKRALELATKQGIMPLLWKIYYQLSLWYQYFGRHEEAQKVLQLSQGIITEIANNLGDSELRDSFLNARPIREIISSQ